MASCFTLTSTAAGQVPIYSVDAVKNNGTFTCSSGAFIILSPEDFQSNAWTTEDGVTLGWTIGAIWLSVYAVMFIARTFQKMMGSLDDSIT